MSEATGPNPFAGELLETSASGYASLAAERMLDAHPEVRRAFAPGAHLSWRDHLQLRVRELAAAVATGSPELFRARVLWSGQSFAARGIERSAIVFSLEALRAVLADKLPGNALDAPIEIVDDALAALAGPLPESGSVLDAGDPAQAVALGYLQTVLEGDVVAAMQGVLDEQRGGRSAESVICDVLMPAQAEIGRLWHLNQLTIAEEHLVSGTTARLMAVLADRAPRRAPTGRSVLVSAMPHDAHDMGIRGLGYLLELEGWRVFNLGADLPVDEIVGAASYFAVDLVMLSAAMSVELRTVRRVISALDEHAGLDAPVLVGGQAFTEGPDLWRAVGADGWAPDARGALREAERLVAARRPAG
jgi:methanogenic corrinoid protein MtbC1